MGHEIGLWVVVGGEGRSGGLGMYEFDLAQEGGVPEWVRQLEIELLLVCLEMHLMSLVCQCGH